MPTRMPPKFLECSMNTPQNPCNSPPEYHPNPENPPKKSTEGNAECLPENPQNPWNPDPRKKKKKKWKTPRKTPKKTLKTPKKPPQIPPPPVWKSNFRSS